MKSLSTNDNKPVPINILHASPYWTISDSFITRVGGDNIWEQILMTTVIPMNEVMAFTFHVMVSKNGAIMAGIADRATRAK